MSQQHYAQHRHQPTESAATPRNWLGTVGFITGLIGLGLSPVPKPVGLAAWPLVVIGLVLCAIGLSLASKRRATNKGLAITGMALSVAGLVGCVLWATVFATASDNAEAKKVAVHYEVTGTATNVTITITTFGTDVTMGQETAATLPWRKNDFVNGLIKGVSLAVTTDGGGGTVACKLTMEGKPPKSATVTGAFATATCSNY